MNEGVSIYDKIGKGFETAWNFRGRYRIIKGSRNSKKSVVMLGYRIIMDILENPQNNVMVLRQNERDNRQSTFANVIKWMNELGISEYFKVTTNVMEIIYKATGQKIFFRGLNNPTSLTSTTVSNGVLSKIYIEEAFEIKTYEDFRKVDGSLRGKPPHGVNFQITLVLNAWSIKSWIYERFFKDRFEDDYDYLLSHPYQDFVDEDFVGDYGIGLYLMTNNYKVNEFRDSEVYDVAMEELRKRAPDIFRVEGLGMWGNASGACYPEMSDGLIQQRGVVNKIRLADFAIGIDTGLSDGEGGKKKEDVRSATTMQLIGISQNYEKIVCIDEYYHTNAGLAVPKTEPQLMEELMDTIEMWMNRYAGHQMLFNGDSLVIVYVDAADIGFRQGMEMVARRRGFMNLRFIGSTKHRIRTRVDFVRLLMAWDEFVISEGCPNLIRELRNARKGENGEAREDSDDHAINANEYAWAPFMRKMARWKFFKEH